jgi:hypothetical protein
LPLKLPRFVASAILALALCDPEFVARERRHGERDAQHRERGDGDQRRESS